MLRTSGLALALWVAAGAASATEHVVMLIGDGVFPEEVFLEIGDTVVFANASEAAATVHATDDTWTSEAIEPAAAFVLEITEDMTMTYQRANGLASGFLDHINEANVETNMQTGETFAIPVSADP